MRGFSPTGSGGRSLQVDGGATEGHAEGERSQGRGHRMVISWLVGTNIQKDPKKNHMEKPYAFQT